ncbi:hypothetical protein AN478_11285 [Thiohalorhabdus denitrificans]|nr:hypothetical protein AN478_11285 [Thiohalorhabdus denitrificans]
MVTALLAVLGGVLVPHLAHLPLWVTGGVAAAGLLRLWIARTGRGLPPRWLLAGLTLGGTAGVWAAFGTLADLAAGVALLAAMGGLKLLELRRRRDALVLLYLGFFLLAAQFLFSQAPWTVAYLLGGMWVLTALLVAAGRDAEEESPWAHAGLAARLVGQAVPVAAVLFLLFPRLDGPLLGLPEEGSAVTGLDDRLAPGAVSQLSRSDAVAFRATFADAPPPPGQRYWRGPVLAAYDGREWRPAAASEDPPELGGEAGSELDYRVLLEPHSRRWLFALDLPARDPGGARRNGNAVLRTEEPVREVTRYRMRSRLHAGLREDLSGEARDRHLRLPKEAHPRARALAEEWRREAANAGEVLRRALAHLRRQDFAYTLQPPAYGENWVDGFLFEDRRGFCGHYAGAFAFLMRAAGVPARVVTGYLGGEPNPAGDYLIVRQSDAHAWTEVWLPEEGWVRVDPTVAVSPARAEEGLAGSVPEEDPVPDMARSEGSWLRDVRFRLDALETAWNRWVLGYDAQVQRDVLGRFGLGDWPRMVAGLAAGLVLAGGLVAGLVLWRGRTRREPAVAAFARLERKLARAGLRRHPAEGPAAFGERAAAALPDQAEAIRRAISAYIRLRYTLEGAPEGLRELRRRVAEVRVPRKPKAAGEGQG